MFVKKFFMTWKNLTLDNKKVDVTYRRFPWRTANDFKVGYRDIIDTVCHFNKKLSTFLENNIDEECTGK